MCLSSPTTRHCIDTGTGTEGRSGPWLQHRGGCVRRLETDLEMRNVMRNSNITLHSTQQQRRVRPADGVTVITNMLPLCASTCRIVDTPAHCRGLGRPLTRPPPPPTNQGDYDGRGQRTASPMLTAIMSGGVGISGRELSTQLINSLEQANHSFS